MSNKIRLVWYGPSCDLEIIGDVQVNKDGSFSGQITDQRVKRMIEADLFLDMGFTARASMPAVRKIPLGSKAMTSRDLDDQADAHDIPEYGGGNG